MSTSGDTRSFTFWRSRCTPAARTYKQWQLRFDMTLVLRNVLEPEYLGGLVPRRLRDSTYRLLGRFRKPNRRLAALLGRDLSHWDK